MADQTITIRLTDNIHALCFPRHVDLFVDDTIRYVSDPPDRPLRVVFDGSPFSNVPALEITDQNSRPLQVAGHFFWKCFLTREDGLEVGWFSGEDPESGGDGDVRPKPNPPGI
jgi:hypothetical protein